MTLVDEVECDEAYVIAGHKGQPEVVKNKGRQGRRRRLKGKSGRGTLEKERPPVFGMIQRGGQVVINLLANVQQKTIEPFIKGYVQDTGLCRIRHTPGYPAHQIMPRLSLSRVVHPRKHTVARLPYAP